MKMCEQILKKTVPQYNWNSNFKHLNNIRSEADGGY